MKKGIPALILACALLLSGCTSMLERSHVSSASHVDYSVTEDSSILRVKTYQDLVNSILYFVNERADSGTIRLYNYTGNVETDLSNACSELLQRDPLCAYSVRTVNYDSTRILTYYEVDLTFEYNRTAEEVAAIRNVTGISGLRQELAAMVKQQSDRLTMLVSYFSGSADLVRELFTLARYAEPTLYHDSGTFSYDLSCYPETGSRRIIEIRVNKWGDADEETLTETADRLEETCGLLLEANPPSGSSYTVDELAAILRASGGGYDYYGTSFPLETLSGNPSNHMGYFLSMLCLCQRCGIEAIPVVNQGPGYNMSLIVNTQDGYRHLLPQDLFPVPPEEGQDPAVSTEPQPIPLYTDDGLEALGYRWTRALYPACEGPEEPPSDSEPAPDGDGN